MIFYADNTLFTRNFGVSPINKQSENAPFKVLCVIFEEMSDNIQNIGVKQLKQTKFGHLFYPKVWNAVHFLSAKTSSAPK